MEINIDGNPSPLDNKYLLRSPMEDFGFYSLLNFPFSFTTRKPSILTVLFDPYILYCISFLFQIRPDNLCIHVMFVFFSCVMLCLSCYIDFDTYFLLSIQFWDIHVFMSCSCYFPCCLVFYSVLVISPMSCSCVEYCQVYFRLAYFQHYSALSTKSPTFASLCYITIPYSHVIRVP